MFTASRGQRWAVRPFFYVVGLCALVGATMAPGAWKALGILVVLGLLVWIEFRFINARIVVEPDVLRIRNHFRSYVIPWEDIDEVFTSSTSGAIRLTSGKRILLQGMTVGPFGKRKPLEEPLRRIELHIRAHRSDPSPRPG